MSKNILLIFFMGVITFFCRYCFIGLQSKREISEGWSKRLSYLPPAFLATMIVPSIVFTESTTSIDIIGNPYFYATVLTLIVTKFTKNFTLITVVGTLIFFAVKFAFSFL